MKIVDASELDLSQFVRPGDTVTWGQACGEPLTLTETMVAQRARIGKFRAIIGATFSQTFKPEHADFIEFTGSGAIGSARSLARAGVLDILPMHVSSFDAAYDTGLLPCDVAFIQVSPPDRQGRYSPGLMGDFVRTAVRRARTVIAEVNQQVPFVAYEDALTDDEIDIRVDTDRTPVQLAPARISETDRKISEWALNYIPDRAVIQIGVGALPEALIAVLNNHKGLGIHSGLISDGIMTLIQSGVVTNEHKEIDRGVTLTGALIGTERLYRFCNYNKSIKLAPVSQTHNSLVLAKLSRFVSINSAIEVDLTGQVNAEAVGADYIGAIGGQVDYVRGAALSPGGRSIIALPSTTADGKSRIVAALSGPVTTPRSDVDLIVTEYGAAELRAKSLRERVRSMIKIAHPSHREELERAVAKAKG